MIIDPGCPLPRAGSPYDWLVEKAARDQELTGCPPHLHLIHGRLYDLTKFADRHPGGREWLDWWVRTGTRGGCCLVIGTANCHSTCLPYADNPNPQACITHACKRNQERMHPHAFTQQARPIRVSHTTVQRYLTSRHRTQCVCIRTRGSDCTVAYEVHHIDQGKADALLAKYASSLPPPQFRTLILPFRSALYLCLLRAAC